MAPLRAPAHLMLMVLTPGILLAACAEEDTSEAPPPEEAPVVRPASVDTLEADLSEQALPDALGEDGLFVASDTAFGTMAGGVGGLFTQGAGGFEVVDETPVRGLVPLPGTGFLVGRDDGLKIWDGAIKDTSLDEVLGESAVTALTAAGGSLWIATGEALWLVEDTLTAFEDLGGIVSIATFEGASDVLLRGANGSLHLLRKDGDDWTVQALESEPVDVAFPGAGGRVLGLDGGTLVERVGTGEGVVAWRRVALSMDSADKGAEAVEAMAVDPSSGAVWVIGADSIASISGDAVVMGAKPEGMDAIEQAIVSSDGRVWLSDGEGLWSVGADGEAISFEVHIAGFSEENCARCHGGDGIGHPIITYDQWAEESESILEQIETGAMPADERQLVGGSAELVRRWIEGGLLP